MSGILKVSGSIAPESKAYDMSDDDVDNTLIDNSFFSETEIDGHQPTYKIPIYFSTKKNDIGQDSNPPFGATYNRRKDFLPYINSNELVNLTLPNTTKTVYITGDLSIHIEQDTTFKPLNTRSYDIVQKVHVSAHHVFRNNASSAGHPAGIYTNNVVNRDLILAKQHYRDILFRNTFAAGQGTLVPLVLNPNTQLSFVVDGYGVPADIDRHVLKMSIPAISLSPRNISIKTAGLAAPADTNVDTGLDRLIAAYRNSTVASFFLGTALDPTNIDSVEAHLTIRGELTIVTA